MTTPLEHLEQPRKYFVNESGLLVNADTGSLVLKIEDDEDFDPYEGYYGA